MILFFYLQLLCFVCFFVSLLGILLHSPISIYLLLVRRKYHLAKAGCSPPPTDEADLPLQLIQLPVYNEEVALVKGLLDSACAVRYPRGKLYIQLLDDSDRDEYREPIRSYVDMLRRHDPELRLHYLHREERGGYKAGNLNFGLHQALVDLQGEKNFDPDTLIVSIFDADFRIPEDYLLALLPHWRNPDVGAVQAKLSFANRNSSLLHRAVAIYMDNLHDLDFASRSASGHLSMFRGSAGSLRFSMIEACGRWQGDTQIEDVDLSFHGQTLGWRIVYSDDVAAASLLPTDYNGFKLQQRSWLKGLMEVMKKNLGRIWRSPYLNLSRKAMGAEFFLVFALQPLFMLTTHLCLIPTYLFWERFWNPEILDTMALLVPVVLAATHIPFFTLNMGEADATESGEPVSTRLAATGFGFLLMVALFVTLSFGAVEGLLGVRVHRDRTSKQGEEGGEALPGLPPLSSRLLAKINLAEWLMAAYSIGLVGWAIVYKHWQIAVVYSTLGLIYPANALISFYTLRCKGAAAGK